MIANFINWLREKFTLGQIQKSGPNSVNIQAKGDLYIDGKKWTNHKPTYERHPDNIVDDLKRNPLEVDNE